MAHGMRTWAVAAAAAAVGVAVGAGLTGGASHITAQTASKPPAAPAWADDPTGKKEAAAFLKARAAEVKAQKALWQSIAGDEPHQRPWYWSLEPTVGGIVWPRSFSPLGAVATLRHHLSDIQLKSIESPETPAGPVLARFEIIGARHDTLAAGPIDFPAGFREWKMKTDEKELGGFGVRTVLYWVTLNNRAGVPPIASGIIEEVRWNDGRAITSWEASGTESVRVDVVDYAMRAKSSSARRLDDGAAILVEGEMGWTVAGFNTLSSKAVTMKYVNALVAVFDLSMQRVRGARAFASTKATCHPGRTPAQLAEIERYLKQKPFPDSERVEDWGLGYEYSRAKGLRRIERYGIPVPMVPPPPPLDFSGWE